MEVCVCGWVCCVRMCVCCVGLLCVSVWVCCERMCMCACVWVCCARVRDVRINKIRKRNEEKEGDKAGAGGGGPAPRQPTSVCGSLLKGMDEPSEGVSAPRGITRGAGGRDRGRGVSSSNFLFFSNT